MLALTDVTPATGYCKPQGSLTSSKLIKSSGCAAIISSSSLRAAAGGGRPQANVELNCSKSATTSPTMPVVIVLFIRQKPPSLLTAQLPVVGLNRALGEVMKSTNFCSAALTTGSDLNVRSCHCSSVATRGERPSVPHALSVIFEATLFAIILIAGATVSIPRRFAWHMPSVV